MIVRLKPINKICEMFLTRLGGERPVVETRGLFLATKKKKTGYLHSVEKVVKRFTKTKPGRWRKQSGEHTIHERERRVVTSGWVSKEVQKCVLRTWVKKPRSFLKSKARIVVELHSYGQRTCEVEKDMRKVMSYMQFFQEEDLVGEIIKRCERVRH